MQNGRIYCISIASYILYITLPNDDDDMELILILVLRNFQVNYKKQSLYFQDSTNALNGKFKFGIIKAKKGETVRDRGSNTKT